MRPMALPISSGTRPVFVLVGTARQPSAGYIQRDIASALAFHGPVNGGEPTSAHRLEHLGAGT